MAGNRIPEHGAEDVYKRQGLLAAAPLYDFFLYTAQVFEEQDLRSAAVFGSERSPGIGPAEKTGRQDMW